MSRIRDSVWAIVPVAALIAALACGGLAPARAAGLLLDGATSGAEAQRGGAVISLGLSAPVPYRVFVLDEPRRLVVDVEGVVAGGIAPEAFAAKGLAGARFGLFSPKWSRLVVDLDAPMLVAGTGYSSGGVLTVTLERTSEEVFEAAAGAPPGVERYEAPVGRKAEASGKLMVAIDAGHGGIDPGAVRDGVVEKDIVLGFAREFAALAAEGGQIDVMLVRDGDYFISLSERVARARGAGADLFISVHADTVERGHASGATVHTRAERASDQKTAAFAARENSADAQAGVDIAAELDAVHNVLADMASRETDVRSRDFADQLVERLRFAVGVLSTDPHRSGRFSVLRAHDMPSVLLELGFLSSAADRQNLEDPLWRADAARALLEAIGDWAASDEARRARMFR